MPAIQRICPITQRTFLISEAEQDIVQRISERNPSLGAPLPLPCISPVEVVRQFHVYMNVRNLYHTKSSLTGASTLSRYNPTDGYRVVTVSEFWSDQVDGL